MMSTAKAELKAPTGFGSSALSGIVRQRMWIVLPPLRDYDPVTTNKDKHRPNNVDDKKWKRPNPRRNGGHHAQHRNPYNQRAE
jgi:hypothetical protein